MYTKSDIELAASESETGLLIFQIGSMRFQIYINAATNILKSVL